MLSYNLSHLKQLEAEAIFIMRETAASFERPVLLFSGGKDSIVMTRIAQKAFHPAKIPFSFLHADTGHNFDETIQYRDDLVKKLGVNLNVASVQDSIDKGRAQEEKGINPSRNGLQTITLLDAIEAGQYDACFGEAGAMKKRLELKNDFLAIEMNLGNGIPKINVQNYGTYLIQRKI